MNIPIDYNNEVIASFSVLSLLNHARAVNTLNAALILPALLHYPTVAGVTRLQSKVSSIEEWIGKRPDIVVGYSERFQNCFPLFTDAITILQGMGLIAIRDEIVSLIVPKIEIPDSLGKRAQQINKAAGVLFPVFLDSPEKLYYFLRIEL